ncbi:MAG: hypothetical protein AMXMBFR57_35870 [Acidimicrobiia bacterium]
MGAKGVSRGEGRPDGKPASGQKRERIRLPLLGSTGPQVHPTNEDLERALTDDDITAGNRHAETNTGRPCGREAW